MAGALYFFGIVFGNLGGVIGGEVLTSIILPHRANPPLVDHLGPDRRGSLYGLRPVAFLPPGYWLWVLFANGVGAAGNRDGSLAGHQGLQPGCSQETG